MQVALTQNVCAPSLRELAASNASRLRECQANQKHHKYQKIVLTFDGLSGIIISNKTSLKNQYRKGIYDAQAEK